LDPKEILPVECSSGALWAFATLHFGSYDFWHLMTEAVSTRSWVLDQQSWVNSLLAVGKNNV